MYVMYIMNNVYYIYNVTVLARYVPNTFEGGQVCTWGGGLEWSCPTDGALRTEYI